MGDGEHFFSQSCHLGFRLHSPLQISQCYEELRFLRLVVAVLLSEWWCDLSCRYWPATIRLFIEVNHSSREWCLSTGCWLETWNLWFCHSLPSNTAYQGPSPPSGGFLGIWIHPNNMTAEMESKNATTGIGDVEKLWKDCESLTSSGRRPTKLPMKGSKFVASGRSKSWLGTRMLVQCLKMDEHGPCFSILDRTITEPPNKTMRRTKRPWLGAQVKYLQGDINA